MITAPELRTLLDGLARRFENRPQSDEELGSVARGWGQFLDGQPQHNQIGPFGTCSGIITRALADRGTDHLDHQVNELIELWWHDRNDSKSHARFLGQTIRLAMLHLAIRLKHDAALTSLKNEIETTLIKSVRTDKMWGNYKMPHDIEDPSPRLIASSLVVLSFMLFRPVEDVPPEGLIDAVKKIEDRILGAENLPRLHVAVASAAILSIPSYTPGREVLRRVSKLAYATQVSLPELGVYFYDYEYEERNEEANSKPKRFYKTDYFIVPTELVLGIAGYQPKAPTYLRLRAETNLKLLVKNLQGFDGFYRPDNEQRISSVNQGWVAMYLALAERALDSQPSFKSGSIGLTARIWYVLIKQRPDRIWLDTLMFSLCGFFFIMGSVLPYSGFTIPASLTKLCITVLAFLAGRLYAPVFIKRIFVERS